MPSDLIHQSRVWPVWLLGAALFVSACDEGKGSDAGSVKSAPSASSAAPPSTVDTSAKLTFKRMGVEIKTLTLGEILAKITPATIKQIDPYYGREKSYRAVPLAKLLDLVFEATDLPKQEYVLRAKDGYTVPMRGSLAMEDGAYIAFEDVDAPGWELIGEQRANPGPFYLVWSKKEQANLDTHPRPYELVSIEIARFEDVFPRTVPVGIAKGEPAERGFQTFREQCILCHAINREGGRVGPDLNVPKSIVEYRPVDQIRAYIQDPRTFRYSQMPAHPNLTPSDLDDLVAYFTAMKDRKQDADAIPSSSASPAGSASAAPSASAPAAPRSPRPTVPTPPATSRAPSGDPFSGRN